MKKVAVIVFLPLLALSSQLNTCQARVRTPQLSEAEMAAQRENELRQTPLKIGSDCQPLNWMTKLNLKTLNESQTKFFWLGQRYAVERTYRENLEQQRITQMNNYYDDQIAALERKRDAANMAAYGVKPYQSAELNRAMNDADRVISSVQADLARSNQRWAEKCYRYADERSK